jgi:SAM-dependent methyltransferase
MNMLRAVARTFLKREASSPEKASSYYDKLFSESPSYNNYYAASHYYFLWAVIVDRLRQSHLRRVLEIGCGSGQLAAMLFDLGVVDGYTGLDFSPRAIEIARANVPRGEFCVDDARSTSLHEEVEHDVVICTEVLEHIEDDVSVLSRFRPGKRCLCTVPSFAHESHVRCFPDDQAVTGRYGSFFDSLQVAVYRSPMDRTDLFFLLDGVRRKANPAGLT